MNYGGGQWPQDSGEIGALKFVANSLPHSHRSDDSPLVVFDVGANDGEYLNCASGIFGARMSAYAFEPQKLCFANLESGFGGDARVRLVNAALGKTKRTSELFLDDAGSGLASLRMDPMQAQPRSQAVAVTTVDSFCRENSIGHIDLLKIDTEGYEMEVLQGASSMIESGKISFVQLEFGETFLRTPHHFLDVWLLLSARYTAYRILRHGLVGIPCYSADLEIYKTANFLFQMK